jgi:hypothetical protein
MTQASSSTFINKANRGFAWWALGLSIASFIVFKFCYPYPDFISDSYNYIESAAKHLDVNLWPIGYAKFLTLVHLLSANDTLLVGIQYAFLQISLLVLFYTLLDLFRPSRGMTRLLFVVLLVNPVFLWLANCIMSDALFATLSIAWISLLLQQLRAPSRIGLLIQVLLVAMAFVVRPTAMYYPFIGALVILLVPIKRIEKLAWILAPVLLILPFVLFSKAKTKAITGIPQFSVFSGWQIANNALYMYPRIEVDSSEIPPETLPIDRESKQYVNWLIAKHYNLALDGYAGGFFLKQPETPLKTYMNRHYNKELNTNAFLAWGKVSPMYAVYGSWLIRHYPIDFARYFLWLNTKNYFLPPLEKFSIYNYGQDSIWEIAQAWFRYPSLRIHSLSKALPSILFFPYPPIFFIINLYFLGCMLWLGFTGKWRLLSPIFHKALLIIAAFGLLNFCFSVFAAPIVLRYQITPYVLIFSFSLLLFGFTDSSRLNPQSAQARKI